MLSNPFQAKYVLVEPRNDAKFTLRCGKNEERAYYLDAIYGYHRGTKEECLAGASEKGYLGVTQYLVGVGADIHAEHDEALKMASEEGHLEVVKYLMGV